MGRAFERFWWTVSRKIECKYVVLQVFSLPLTTLSTSSRCQMVQGFLRSVVHNMRTLGRSPYALQPPHPNALPSSFSTAQIPTPPQPDSEDDDDDLFSDPEEKLAKTKKVLDDAEKEARELSLYACRLELKALKELAESLRALKSENSRKETSGDPSKADGQEQKDDEGEKTISKPGKVTLSTTAADVEMDQ